MQGVELHPSSAEFPTTMAGVERIERLAHEIYRGRVKRAARASGISVLLDYGLWAAYRTLNRGRKTVRIDDSTATFHVPTRSTLAVVGVAETVERPIYRDLLGSLRSDDVFWDVGANIGTYSCLAGSILDDGRVVSVEPYPPNVTLLKRNLRENAVHATVVPTALSDTLGSTTLWLRYDDEPGSQEHTVNDSGHETDSVVDRIEVPVWRGDALIETGDVPAPNLLKIDAEGEGMAVLAGLESTLVDDHSTCRRIYLEPHGNAAELESRLEAYGYDVERRRLGRHRATAEPILVASRSELHGMTPAPRRQPIRPHR